MHFLSSMSHRIPTEARTSTSSTGQEVSAIPRPTPLSVVHMTTAHRADDVRIFERECRSLAATGRCHVYLAAAGTIPADSGVTHLTLPPRPTGRIGRFAHGPLDAWKLARSHNFDIWHFHDPELLPVAIRLAQRGQTVIWDAHEDYLSQFTSDGGKNWVPKPLRGIARSGMHALLVQADRTVSAVVAATPTIAGRYSNPRTVVVGNEARLSDFANCSPSFTARQVLFIGSPGPEHLFPEVVEAIESMPDVRLLVAGREPSVTVWAAVEQKLGTRVHHAGWLDRKGLVDAISKSSIGLVTYQRTAAYSATSLSPIKLFEFAASGLPVVTVPLPAIVDRLAESKAGVVASGFTSNAIADAMRVASSEPFRWEQMSQAGRSWASEHGSWTSSEKRLLGLYAALTERG